MATSLELKATEEGTYVINIAPEDEDDAAVTPQTGTWTLTDLDGNTINGKENVTISSLSTSMDVVLSGDDLAMSANDLKTEGRRFLFKGTYNSTLGNNLPLNASCEFDIVNLLGIT